MKRFAILICLVGVVQGSEVASAGAFPWVRTRPKPILLENPPIDETKAVQSSTNSSHAQTRVMWHGTAAYPGSGRLYFQDASDRPGKRKSHVSDAVTRGWRGASGPSQAKR
jgi:hypothetical protein